MASKQDLLEQLTVGSRVAEEEAERLATYFVETDQWRRVISGEVDIIFGNKGAGKSALYASLTTRASDLFDRGILLISAENPRGQPAFRDLVDDPPATEFEFAGMWKLFVLSLIGQTFIEFGFSSSEATEVIRTLDAAGLARGPNEPLRTLVRNVRDYIKRLVNPESVEAGLKIDPSKGVPTGITAKVTLREPGATERAAGDVSADRLFELAEAALAIEGLSLWVLFDRLDVAFADTRELEANALRALFKVYRDLAQLSRVSLKIFLRSDIWRAITAGGFREASHITDQLEIAWNPASLLNLLVLRLLQNAALTEAYGVDAESVKADAGQQREFFERLVPDQIDSGRNPSTFEWMLGRIRDGTGFAAPRELIHLATRTRDVQLAMLERGETEPTGEVLLSRQAFRDALPEVSRVRLEQTLYAENPDLRRYIEVLEGQKTNQTIPSLQAIWQVDADAALSLAMQLVEVGFFERRGTREDPHFWVPFLYRPALSLVQGSADGTPDGVDEPD